MRATTGRWPRVLFIAHRDELLRRTDKVLRRLLAADRAPPPKVGWFAGDLDELDAPFVVASVAKLARPAALARLGAQRFDYVVIDEVHHVDAPSYRKILDRLDPSFLLELTATPDRADEGNVLGLFDDFVASRADVGEGIERGFLVPFACHCPGALRDVVDYANIPWRNRRFDPQAEDHRRLGRAQHHASRGYRACGKRRISLQ